MPLQQKSMKLGAIYLGTWIYDCTELKSGIRLSTKRPSVNLEISFGKDVGKTIAGGLSLIPGEFGKKAGNIVKKNFPQIDGKISISIEAEPMTIICHDKKGKKVQTVGWDAALQIIIEGKIKTPAVTFKGKIVLPIIIEGDRVDCDCNNQLSYNDKFNIGKREVAVVIPPRIPCNPFVEPVNFSNEIDELGQTLVQVIQDNKKNYKSDC